MNEGISQRPAGPGLTEQLASSGIVAILRGDDDAVLLRTAEVLVANGVTCLEFPLRSHRSFEVIRRAVSTLDSRVAVGAGTVLDAESARRAIDAGAAFLVSPVVARPVLEAGAELGVPVYPGAWTPSEVYEAWCEGAAAVKVFPASIGGPDYIGQLRAPLPDIPLVPTGGIAIDAVADYLRAGALAVGLGTPLVGSLAGEVDETAVAARARRVLAAVQAVRHG